MNDANIAAAYPNVSQAAGNEIFLGKSTAQTSDPIRQHNLPSYGVKKQKTVNKLTDDEHVDLM